MQPTTGQLAEIQQLYDSGLYLQAFRLSEAVGPLSGWAGTEARVLAGRLAMCLGNEKLGGVLHYLAWRQDRSHSIAANYFGRHLMRRYGPYAAWQHFQRLGPLEGATSAEKADRLSCIASILTMFRDFERAQSCVDQALELSPTDPWHCIAQSELLLSRDQREEALRWAERSLALRQWYRPAIQIIAQCYVELARNDRAIELLSEASKHIESNFVLYQLMSLLFIEERYDEAHALLGRVHELSPMQSGHATHRFLKWQADLAYARGDLEAAIEYGSRCPKGSFHAIVSEKMKAAPANAPHQKLELPFVQQNYMTCGPATLASIGPYWGQPIDHLEVARAICYDGTPDHEERVWAQENGWIIREFSVDWDSAKALIDRGVPFTLTTVTPLTAHLQAVVGYDARRGLLLIRDPSSPGLVEFLAEQLIEDNRSTGPRGSAMVPIAEAARLEGLNLPDTALFDYHFLLKRALVAHQREEAQRLYDRQVELDDDHRLTLRSRWTLAIYDNDMRGCLEAVERLLELFPDDVLLKLRKHGYLQQLATRGERISALEKTCAEPGIDPILFVQLADELASDPREVARAVSMLRRAIKAWPFEPYAYTSLAKLFDTAGRYQDAFELSRIAASLGSADEYLQQEFCKAARNVRRHEEALNALRRRAEEAEEASGLPLRTLHWALSTWQRTDEGFDALEKGIARHPDDGDLTLYAAVEYAKFGRFSRADELLVSSRGKVRRAEWLLGALRVASEEGHSRDALEHGLELCKLEPGNAEAHSLVASLLELTHDRAAALAHLDAAVTATPRDFNLQLLRVERLRGFDEGAAEKALRTLIDQEPTHAWSHREIALCLIDQRRLEPALAAADEGVRLEPACSASHHVRGHVLEEMGDFEGAADCYHRALSMEIDDVPAMVGLVRCSRSAEERSRSLKFIQSELERQVVLDEALAGYRQVAGQTLDGEEVLVLLEAARDARPDLWQTWCESARQLLDLHRADEAIQLLNEATRRYPRVGELWMTFGQANEMQGDTNAQIEALEKAVDTSPSWSMATFALADALENAGELERAENLLASSLLRSPANGYFHGCLASVLWKRGETERALNELNRGLTLEPGYRWGWAKLTEWSNELGRAAAPLELAQTLSEEYAGDDRVWYALSERYRDRASDDRTHKLAQALVAIEHAIELNPLEVDYHDERALTLAEQGRYQEALEACHPSALGSNRPIALRCREAWIYAQAGQIDEAINALEQIVDEEPGQVWAWQQLYDFQLEREDYEAAEVAATALIRLAPRDGQPRAMLAHVLLSSGRAQEGREVLEKCVALDSQYRWAALRLLGLLIESGELDEAKQLAIRLIAADDNAELRSQCVRLAVELNDSEAALIHYAELLSSADADFNDLSSATQRLVESFEADAAWAALDAAVAENSARAPLVAFWAYNCVERGLDASFTARVREAGEDWPHRSVALTHYIESLAAHRRKETLRWLREEHPEWFERDTAVWGSMGFAMLEVGDKDTAVWLKQWRNRKGLKPWILLNVVAVAMEKDRIDEAIEAAQKALEVGPPEDVSEHVIVLDYYEALEPDRTVEPSLRPRVRVEFVSPFYKMIRGLTYALKEAARTDIDSRAAFRLARKRFKAACAEANVWKYDTVLRPLRKQTARTIAARCGGFRAWLWQFMT
ncbi:MAG: tetratricopeptide repeat protein [Betaproteobacteria bacterium]|nr:MAG: tetratricopeptide repeat protein [Betaproteobacteria bacterium]